MGLTHKGVNYDVGTNYLPDGVLSRGEWRPDLMRQEIRAVRDQLHANSVGIYGTDLDRLVQTATVALENGLHVWLQPRLIDAAPQKMLDHLARTAEAAELLRKKYEAIDLNVGCELTVFSAGIIPGASHEDRSAKLGSPLYWPLFPWFNRKLNRLLGEAAAVARSAFRGRITYGAGLWEGVDWTPFDVVGLDYYRMPYNRSRYVKNLRRFHQYGKPVVIVEFGCGGYDGAAEKGPSSHAIIDRGGPTPVINGSWVRNERVQAEQIAELIGIFEEENVQGAYVFEFIEPHHPHSADPRHDLDMAGYGIVKVIQDEAAGSYRWEPKAAFHEVARLYGGQA
ncbi:abortive phage infection protein [Nonomuraea sp. NN258]|uniref:abortive phage infection protein n=1 Tax=Nonomuraea antri TaxID=2730852 RepID=UPI001568E438|nr:abortive phage infection protein [Nonomuraea antri]NRQ37105.1 abortive phage infection protein [Nonomuraea antri]